VAQYADACNLFVQAGANVLQHKLNVLQSHCEDLGRDYAEIEKTGLGTAFLADLATPEALVDFCGEMAELGITHMIFNLPDAHKLTNIETIAEKVIPQVASL
jgi:alkanesulfonate monooxygenase